LPTDPSSDATAAFTGLEGRFKQIAVFGVIGVMCFLLMVCVFMLGWIVLNTLPRTQASYDLQVERTRLHHQQLLSDARQDYLRDNQEWRDTYKSTSDRMVQQELRFIASIDTLNKTATEQIIETRNGREEMRKLRESMDKLSKH
jgi:hypothetical protein